MSGTSAHRVAEYAVPASFVVVGTLPRRGPSAVDRAAVREPFGPQGRNCAVVNGYVRGADRVGSC